MHRKERRQDPKFRGALGCIQTSQRDQVSDKHNESNKCLTMLVKNNNVITLKQLCGLVKKINNESQVFPQEGMQVTLP